MAGGNKGAAVQVKLRGNILSHPVYAAADIYRGTMVNAKSGGFAAQADDTTSEIFAGIAEEKITGADVSSSGDKHVRVRRRGIFKMLLNTGANAPTLVGTLVYVHTAQSSSVDELVGIAGNVSNHVLVGMIVKHGTDAQAAAGTSTADIWVDILGTAITTLGDATYTKISDLISTDGAKGAKLVGFDDGGSDYTATDVADALDEIATKFQEKGLIPIPFGSFVAGDGAALLKQAGTEPGYDVLNSKELVITYPDDGNASDLMFGGIPVPMDLDETAGFTIHFLVEKSGTNNADTAFDLTAFMATAGDANNADIVDTTVITLTNSATTIEEIIFTCNVDATNLLAHPATLNGIIDYATVGTDELSVHAAWIEYTKKMAPSA